MILVDGKVNGKAATFLLDTGSNNTIVSPRAAGVDAGTLRALQPTTTGVGSEGDTVGARVSVALEPWCGGNRSVLVMNLDDANKRMGTHIDAFLGQDILQKFKSWRIDYKARVIDIATSEEGKSTCNVDKQP
jgi:predicted aspartyl protease